MNLTWYMHVWRYADFENGSTLDKPLTSGPGAAHYLDFSFYEA